MEEEIKRPKTKITIENEYGTYSVEKNENLVTIDDYYEYLIKPILLSASFSESLINEYFEQEEIGNPIYKNLYGAIDFIKTNSELWDGYEYLSIDDVASALTILSETIVTKEELTNKEAK